MTFFKNSGGFWNWVVASASDPNAVALTVKGATSFAAVQAIFGLLPLIGIHPGFDLNGLGDQLYTLTFTALTTVSALTAFYGAGRKVWLTFVPSKSAA